MGISLIYREITSVELTNLLLSEENSQKFLRGYSEEELIIAEKLHQEYLIDEMEKTFETQLMESGKYIIIGYWQALHYLLTDEYCTVGSSELLPPVRDLVMGGRETQYYCQGCPGRVRYLTPQEVKDVTNYILQLDLEAIKTKYNKNLFNSLSISPEGNDWKEDSINNIISEYEKILRLFVNTSNNNDVMLIAKIA